MYSRKSIQSTKLIFNNDYTCLVALLIMFIFQNSGFYYRKLPWFKIKLRYNKIYLYNKLQVQRSEAKLCHSLAYATKHSQKLT
jgi:hypothetical protein